MACAPEHGTLPGGGATVRLAVATQLLAAGHTVQLRASYRNAGDDVSLGDTTVAITGTVRDVALVLDLTACLEDAGRQPPGPGCAVRVTGVLRDDAGDVSDSTSTGPLDLRPDALVPRTAALTLSPVDSVALVVPPTLWIGESATATATVRRRNGTAIPGRAISWASSDPTVATITSAGVITGIRSGVVTISAFSGAYTGRFPLSVANRAPVAYYPFDGDTRDASGNGRDGSAFGVTPTPDRLGAPDRAYRFAGTTSSYIDIGLLPITGDFTIAAFIRPDDNTVGWSIVSNLSTANQLGYEFLLLRPLDGQALRLHTRLGSNLTASAQPLQLGRWYFVAATFSGGTGSIYVDGVLVATRSGLPTPAASGLRTLIGKSGYGTFNFANGAIDEVSIFERALSPAEIDALYRAGGRPQ